MNRYSRGLLLERIIKRQHLNESILQRPSSVLAWLLAGFFIYALLTVSVEAKINPTSTAQVPLPKAFGEPGSVGVSAALGAVFDSIPIEIAPGRRGIKPRLTLSYSSMAGSGTAGLGWSISTGRVERWRGDGTPSIRATVEGVQDDRFSYSLGGAGGELHDDNSDGIYRARIENIYRPFKKNGQGWTMFDGGGVSYSFGSTTNSRIDGELWLIDRIEDSSGNTVTYTYEKECVLRPAGVPCADTENQALYLGSIHYTGFAPTGDPGANQVVFDYEYRPDRRVSYQRGVREAQNLRLQRISVLAQGDLVRRYSLAYERYASGHSVLKEVTLIGADDSSEVTLRTLEYGERPPGWVNSVSGSVPLNLAQADGKSTGVQMMDVDGDGYADLVNNGQEVYLGNGQGGFAISTSWSNSIASAQVSLVGDDGIDTGVRMIDVNADARPDIFIATPTRTQIWINTGSGWVLNSNWSASLNGLSALNIALTDENATTGCLAPHCADLGANPTAGCTPTHCTGDEDNDPPDCILAHNDPDDPELPHCQSPIFTFPSTELFALVGDQGESKGVELADVNADGRIDIVWSLMFEQTQFLTETPRIVRAVFLNGGDDYPGWHENNQLASALADVLTNDGTAAGAFIVENAYEGYSFSDVNGDGFADIVRSIDGKQAIYLGNGSGWSLDDGYTNSMVSQGIFALDADFKSQGLIPMDFNDDGLIDYVRTNGATVSAYLNTGAGWNASASIAQSMAQELTVHAVAFANADGEGTGTTLSDVDGDGIGDLITAKAGTQNRILLSNTMRSGKLLRSVSALGEVTEVNWTMSTAFNNKTAGIEGLPISMALVNNVSRSDGRGSSLVTSFNYAGGKYIDQGFRGFAKIDQQQSAGLRTETKFYQDEERATQPFEVRAYDSLGNLRALSESETIIVDPEPGVKQLLLKSTETLRIDQDGTTNKSLVVRTYDDRMQVVSVFNDDEVGPVGDERTNEYSWARNDEAGIWSYLVRGAVLDASGELKSETITLYDGMPQGQVLRGLPTATREWVERDIYLTRSLSYDDFGNVTEVVDRTGNATTFTYDEATSTFRTAGTDALGRVKRSEYDHRFGTLVRDEDANGNATITTNDAFGRTVRVVAPGDEDSPYGTVTYHYSALGDPQQQFLRLLRTETAGESDVFETVTYFDAGGKIYESQEEGSNGFPIITRIDYGEDGQPSATSLPFFQGSTPAMVTTERDDLGRLVAMTDPLDQTVNLSYSGLKLDVRNARGNTTSVTSNPNGDPIEVSLMVGGVEQITRYNYDALGRLSGVVDALGNETYITYDAVGRRTSLEDPNAGLFIYEYDDEGRLIRQVGPDGKSLLFRYSAAGELLEKILPDGSTQTFVYGSSDVPNAAGRLIEVRDAAGALRIAYDKRGRVVKKRREVGGRTYITGFSYDSMDRVSRVTYPDGFVAEYVYDSGNNLVAVTDRDGRPIADGFQYNASKRITAFNFGNGVTSEFSYDDLARMESTRSSTAAGIDLQELSYVFDSANNVTALDDLTSGSSQLFEYDEANRLVRAEGPYGEEVYQYDAIGNLLQKGDLYFAQDPLHPQRVSCAVEVSDKKAGGKSKSSTIDPCADTLAGILPGHVQRAFSLAYDERGNVVEKDSKRFEYDGENRLIRTLAANGRLIEHNRYDASGELIVKQAPNEKTVFIDGIYEEGKTHVSRHVRAGSLLLATVVTPRANIELISDTNPSYEKFAYAAGIPGVSLLLLLIGFDRSFARRMRRDLAAFVAICRAQPVSITLIFLLIASSWPQPVYAGPKNETGGEKRYYYHANHLGSVNVVTDDDAKVTARRDYRPYGDPHDWSGANAGPRELLQTFQGQQLDDNTGLYNFKARYYDAELGRFLSADTIVSDSGDPRTLNRYAFAGGNPVQFVDPSGRGFWSSVGDFFTGVGEGLVDAGNWVADNAVEILTVIVIIVVVVVLVAATIATGGLLGFALAGAAVGFATFGGIALSQGNTVADAAFWQAAATGAVLGAVVGAAFGAALPATLTGISALGPIASGALLGAAIGGLEQAIACATGCGGVENLLLPVAQGIIIGGIIGGIGGGVAGKFFPKGSTGLKWWGRLLIKPGPGLSTIKLTYTTYSSAGGPGLRGRRTIFGDVFRGGEIGVRAIQGKSLEDIRQPDRSSYFFGLLNDADTGLTTSPTTP